MKMDDPILTAYALGEPLSEAETAAVEKLLAESAEARAFVEETRAFGALLKGEFQAELSATPTEAPVPKVIAMPETRTRRSTVIWWASAAAVATGLLAVGAMINQRPEAGLLAETTTAPSSSDSGVYSPPPLSAEAPLGGDGLSTADRAKITAEAEVAARVVRSRSALEASKDATASGNNNRIALPNFSPPRIAPVPPPMIPEAGTPGEDTRIAAAPRAARAIRTRSLHPEAADTLYAPTSGRAGERYTTQTENAFTQVADVPLSTFSLDVDTASYANVRRMLEQGQLPPPAAVRLEEMVNYFTYDDPAPDPAITGNAPLAVRMESAEAPWKPEHRLVRIGVKAKEVNRAEIKGVNLVFLIDTSGSMSPDNKLPLVKRSLEMLVEQLRPDDRVAIVTYAGTSNTALPSTPVAQRAEIVRVIQSLSASGGTNGAGGLERAYRTAREAFVPEGVNRVILATDGDFNVGMTRDAELEKYIEHEAKSGVFLSILGFGMGNYNDRTMKLLSTRGSGNYAYIDTPDEARKVLGEQMRGTLVTVAKDVKVQVEFNPAKVQGYRLLGYENRLMAKEDFNDDRKDAGEIGAGHHVTALYEVIPVGVPPAVDRLKYQSPEEKPEATANQSEEWLTVKLRYKTPESERSERLELPFTDRDTPLAESSDDLRFAAAVAQYAMLLSGSPHAGAASWEEVIALAEGALGKDPSGYRAAFVRLAARASELANRQGAGWQ